jgi:hypothetical protein
MLVLWTWMLFCTFVAAQVQPVEQAVAALRFFVFTLAIRIMLECWRQYVFGASVLGYRRYIDGALTGPFQRPIAGGTLFGRAVLHGSIAACPRTIRQASLKDPA